MPKREEKPRTEGQVAEEILRERPTGRRPGRPRTEAPPAPGFIEPTPGELAVAKEQLQGIFASIATARTAKAARKPEERWQLPEELAEAAAVPTVLLMRDLTNSAYAHPGVALGMILGPWIIRNLIEELREPVAAFFNRRRPARPDAPAAPGAPGHLRDDDKRQDVAGEDGFTPSLSLSDR